MFPPVTPPVTRTLRGHQFTAAPPFLDRPTSVPVAQHRNRDRDAHDILSGSGESRFKGFPCTALSARSPTAPGAVRIGGGEKMSRAPDSFSLVRSGSRAGVA